MPAAGTCAGPTSYTFRDEDIAPGTVYWYRLAEVGLDGGRTYFGPISVGPVTAGSGGPQRVVPSGNPFRDHALLIGLERQQCLVYDAMGRLAQRCNGANVGANLPAGIYFVMVAGHAQPMKLVKLK